MQEFIVAQYNQRRVTVFQIRLQTPERVTNSWHISWR